MDSRLRQFDWIWSCTMDSGQKYSFSNRREVFLTHSINSEYGNPRIGPMRFFIILHQTGPVLFFVAKLDSDSKKGIFLVGHQKFYCPLLPSHSSLPLAIIAPGQFICGHCPQIPRDPVALDPPNDQKATFAFSPLLRSFLVISAPFLEMLIVPLHCFQFC